MEDIQSTSSPVFDNNKHANSIKQEITRGIITLISALVIAVIIAALLRIFVFQLNIITSGSMSDTLHVGDTVLVSQIAAKKIRQLYLTDNNGSNIRGAVVVFHPPGKIKKDMDFVKRIIALPEETISIRSNTVYINGAVLDENYIRHFPNWWEADTSYDAVTVPAHSFFLLGDNRANSNDSRNWGAVSADNIVGRAVAVVWPPKNWKTL